MSTLSDSFDPNAAAVGEGIFGLPFSAEESKLHLIPVPWDATTSYGKGAALGPQALLRASYQLDLFDIRLGRPYERGIFLQPEDKQVQAWNREANALTQQELVSDADQARVNALSARVNDWVFTTTKNLYGQGKIVGIVGGDHSVPLGAFKAAGEQFGAFGILHFDAHADLRDAYQGYTYSHASIFHNAAKEVASLQKVVQVGIRDFSEDEYSQIQALSSAKRWKTYFDRDLQDRIMNGSSWSSLAQEIVAQLPDQVWVSFDIDGLDPRYCPNTGTPVPGGLDWSPTLLILETLVRSGKRVLGFDLVEVAPSPEAIALLGDHAGNTTPSAAAEWDGNVGMRLLYQLCGAVLKA